MVGSMELDATRSYGPFTRSRGQQLSRAPPDEFRWLAEICSQRPIGPGVIPPFVLTASKRRLILEPSHSGNSLDK